MALFHEDHKARQQLFVGKNESLRWSRFHPMEDKPYDQHQSKHSHDSAVQRCQNTRGRRSDKTH